MNSSKLHVIFLPFLSPGHMIPMVDLAKLFVSRSVRVSIVTTTSNVPLIQPSIDNHPNIELLTIQTSSPIENTTNLPSPAVTPDFVRFIDSLKQPFQQLVTQHRPDFIVSDVFYPWTSDLGLPRLLFCGTNAFCMVLTRMIHTHRLHESTAAADEPFVVTGMPHRIELTGSKLMSNAAEEVDGLWARMGESFRTCYGLVKNTVYGFEAEYVDMLEGKAWAVGPVSLFSDDGERLVRGGKAESECLGWLGRQRAGSVIYVCFGSLGRFTKAQLREIAAGLVGSGCPFLWVVGNGGDVEEWMVDGYDEGKGLVATGWAPQMMILNHASVGGFVTHCGWNSCLEGASAGLPMVTWPLFGEQFYNESLLVDVMGIGVSVGSQVCDMDEEKRTLVKAEQVRSAVHQVMGDGEEAQERRMRAKEASKVAKEAVEEGGHSYDQMNSLVKELMEFKLAVMFNES